MAVMTPRANELSLLMRAADALLNAATDEASVLSHAVGLLGEQLGYSMRYLLLYDAERNELYTGKAAGDGSRDAAVMNYRMSIDYGLTGACARTRAVVNVGDVRSEERRVGKECRSRWSPYH